MNQQVQGHVMKRISDLLIIVLQTETMEKIFADFFKF